MIFVIQAQAMIVFDPANYNQNMLNYLQMMNSIHNQMVQIQNQLQQLNNEARNLMALNGSVSSSTSAGVQQNLANLAYYNQNMRGVVGNYGNMQLYWDSNFKNFAAFNGMSGADYAKVAYQMLQNTDYACYNALNAQSMAPAQIQTTSAMLQKLIQASVSSQGVLSAVQAGNMISALEVQSTLNLQNLMAQSYRAETAYYTSMNQREANSANSNLLQLPKENDPYKGGGQGLGLPKP
jgi:P-type conjugative transfer protein TrbJ